MVSEKKLVEEVLYWIRVFDDGSVDRTWTGPPELGFMGEPVPAHDQFIEGVATRDVTINSKSGVSVRIYMPERNFEDDEVDKLPVLLHFHGGGFCITKASSYTYYHVYTRLVKSARAICVSVDMRLAPEHRLPAPCDDGYSALLWLRDVARGQSTESWLEANADFRRVFLIGDSSGGNIVHYVAACAGNDDLEPLTLAGCVPIHPGFVRAERSKSELENKPDSPFLTLEMVDKFLGFALPIGATKDHPITCPMGSSAPPLSGLKLPPFLIPIAENDLLRDTEMEYCEAMKKAGQDVKVVTSPGMGHCFYLNKIAIDMDPNTAAQTDRLIAAVTDFIKMH